MSIASLFKPVDSSKTRLPRTDVLERVAKYADGKSVVSNYFDISTPELVQMLRSDLVPAPEVEYVTNIVRGRLSGEVGEAPKKSVGEAIKTTPIKKFTVSDPTKDFITLEDVIGKPTAPTGFERGKYLESLIGSGTTGGPTQRGTPDKDEDPYIQLRQAGKEQYGAIPPSSEVGSAYDIKRTKLDIPRGTDSTGDFGSGFSKPADVRPAEDQVARGLDSLQSLKDSRAASIMAENLGGTDAIKVDQVRSGNKPEEGTAATSELTRMSSPDPRNLENTGLFDTLKRYLEPTPTRQYEKEVAQDIIEQDKEARRAGPTQRLRPPVVASTLEPPVKQGTSFTEFLYGRPEAKRMEEEAIATTAGDVTTARMAGREAGIAALPSDVGTAAAEGTRGIVPGGAQQQAYDTQRGGVAPGGELQQAYDTQRGAAPAPAPAAPSTTPATDYRAVPDKPTKDEKKAIQETATAVAKNPSVGGIQSLFEQAGFSDALLQLGLGMMASKNPDFLGSLGEAGQGAVALMAKQREAAKKAKEDAEKMALEERRVAATERSIDNAATADKRPAAVQSAELVANSLQTALKQAAAGQFGTTEQIIAQQHAERTVLPFAERAALQAAKSWQSGFNDATTTKQKEAFKSTFGSSADEASNIAYQKAIERHKLGKYLSLGEEPVVQTAPQTTVQTPQPVLKYNPATGKVE